MLGRVREVRGVERGEGERGRVCRRGESENVRGNVRTSGERGGQGPDVKTCLNGRATERVRRKRRPTAPGEFM